MSKIFVVVSYSDGALSAYLTKRRALDYINTQQDYNPLDGSLYIAEIELHTDMDIDDV